MSCQGHSANGIPPDYLQFLDEYRKYIHRLSKDDIGKKVICVIPPKNGKNVDYTYYAKEYIAAEISIVCNFCYGKADKICSGCKNVAYCDRECQKDDWKEHKLFCRRNKGRPSYNRIVIKRVEDKDSEGELLKGQYLDNWICIEYIKDFPKFRDMSMKYLSYALAEEYKQEGVRMPLSQLLEDSMPQYPLSYSYSRSYW